MSRFAASYIERVAFVRVQSHHTGLQLPETAKSYVLNLLAGTLSGLP